MTSATVYQPGIFEGVPAVARYVTFALTGGQQPTQAIRDALARVSPLVDGSDVVLGIGPSLVAALGTAVPGLHEFPDFGDARAQVPSTPTPLWVWLRGDDLGDLLYITRKAQKALAPAFTMRHVVDAFRHRLGDSGHGRDLTGFEDGTENPTGKAAEQAAFVHGQGPGLDGSSFVAIQQWVHDLDAFEALGDAERDHHVGRRLADNEELEDAPASAHVRRTAQEDFDPPAFMLRRSMPWMMSAQAGLMFVAFGCSLYAFEAQMKRMAGLEDGIVDAMFGISKPVTGAYYWCPPMRDGALDLRQLGL